MSLTPAKRNPYARENPSITIRPHHKVMTKTRAPSRCVFRGIGNCLQIQAPRIFAAHQNREGVIEPQRRANKKIELA